MKNSTKHNLAYQCLKKHPHPEHTALIHLEQDREIRLSWRDLDKLTSQAAQFLSEYSLKVQDIILICIENEIEANIYFLAALRLGILPVLISKTLSERELKSLLDHSKAKYCFTLAGSALLSFKNIQMNTLASLNNLKSYPLCDEMISCSPNDPAFLLYTSGSQGTPKGVVHSHRSILSHHQRLQTWQQLDPGELVFNTSAKFWSYALQCSFLDPLSYGVASLSYQGNLTPQIIWRLLSDYPINCFMSVPAIYRRLLRNVPKQLKLLSLKSAISAGEKIDPSSQKTWEEIFHFPIREGLGMTECSVYLCDNEKQSLHSWSDQHTKLQPYRNSQQEYEMLIHHQHPGLMLGYLNQEGTWDLPLDHEGYFHTGDLFLLKKNNSLQFHCRKDNMLNCGGIRVSPIEIESVLKQIPEIKEVLICEEKIENSKSFLVACIECVENAPHGEKMEALIHGYVQENLSHHKRPRKYYFLAQLKKTKNGKLIRDLAFQIADQQRVS